MNIPKEFNEVGELMDSAKRIQEVVIALLMEGAPDTFWIASRLIDGRTQGAAYPSKAVAMEHTVNPNDFAFIHIVAADGFPSVPEMMAVLKYNRAKEAYWRTDPNLTIHIPKAPVQDLGAYSSASRPNIPTLEWDE